MSNKVKDLFEKSVSFLRGKGIENPRFETELILASVLKTERIGIYLQYETPLNETEVNLLREFVIRKGKGEPTSYIIGEKYFYGYRFAVGPGVLIPRPETEQIIEEVILEVKNKWNDQSILIADLGAGSGCIGITLGLLNNSSSITLVERENLAANYCQRNIHNLVSQNELIRFNLVQTSVESWNSTLKYNIITANPPYIAIDDKEVDPMVIKFEPESALFAKENGLDAIRSWIFKVCDYLVPGGSIYFEIGHKQGLLAKEIFSSTGKFDQIKIITDYSKRDRIIKAVKNG